MCQDGVPDPTDAAKRPNLPEWVHNAQKRPRSADLWAISAWEALICGLSAGTVGFRAFCTVGAVCALCASDGHSECPARNRT